MLNANVLSVSQVTAYIKSLFTADELLSDVWISGEVSNFKPAASGHCYLTLKDGDASIRSVIWRTVAARMTLPRDGDAVVAHGYVSVYEVQGAYQFYIDHLEAAGAGRLWQEFERLRARLTAEGLFRRRPKAIHPGSPQAAGCRHLCQCGGIARYPAHAGSPLSAGQRRLGANSGAGHRRGPPTSARRWRCSTAGRPSASHWTRSSLRAAAAPSKSYGRSTMSVWRVPSLRPLCRSSPVLVTRLTSPSPISPQICERPHPLRRPRPAPRIYARCHWRWPIWRPQRKQPSISAWAVHGPLSRSLPAVPGAHLLNAGLPQFDSGWMTSSAAPAWP